jgi:dolichyl-phosphate beta-glucosyltransferase
VLHPLVYVLPLHDEAPDLAVNVARLAKYLERFPGSEVYLCESGSTDDSWAISQELEQRSASAGRGHTRVRAFQDALAGIGHGLHRGLTEALARFGGDPNRWAILQGPDLPFGFSDIEAALLDLERSPSRILMGSKAHPRSEVGAGARRKALSAIYRVARRASVGMKVGDSQGSVFTRLDLAEIIVPQIQTRGFFYTTELCYHAEREGETIVELPVVLTPGQRPSTTRPLRDGMAMAKELMRLRRERAK